MAGPTIAHVNVEVDLDGSTLPAQARRIGSRIGRTLSRQFDRTLLDAFDDSGERAGARFSASFNRGLFDGMDRTVALVIKLILSIGPQLAALGSALSANVVALLSSSLIGLGGALASLGGPAAAAALSLGLAISAMEGMRKSIPGLEKAIDGIADAWGRQAAAFGAAWGPSLRDFLTSARQAIADSNFGEALGASLATVTQAFAAVISSPGFVAFTTALETTFPSALAGFGKGIASFTSGFMQFFAQAGPAADDLGQRFAGVGARFQEAMDRLAASGQLEAFFTRAKDSFLLLMGVLAPFGAAIGNVLGAGQESGDRLLTLLGDLASKFLDWTKSVEGQQALQTWFEQSEGIFKSLMDVIGVLGTTLADMVTPETLTHVNDFLVTLQDILPIVGEVLSTIGQTNILNIFAQALLGVLQAIQPLLPLLGDLLTYIGNLSPELIQTLAVAFGAMALALKAMQFAQAIAGIKMIATIILELRTAPTIIAAVRGAWMALTAAFAANPIGLILVAISALIAGLVYFFTQTETGKKLWASFVQWLTDLWNGLVSWFTGSFLPAMQAVWDGLVSAVQAVGKFFGDAWQAILDAPGKVVEWFQGTFIPFMASLPGRLIAFLLAYIEFWVSLPGRIIGALASFIAWLIQWGADVYTSLTTWVGNTVTAIIDFFVTLPQRIIDGLSSLGTALGSFFASVWDFLKTDVVNFLVAYVNFWLDLPGKILDAVSSLASTLGSFFGNLWATLTTNISNAWNAIIEFFRGIPAKIGAALGSIAQVLWDTIKRGLGKGNEAALAGISELLQTISKVPGQILSALGNLGSTLYGAGQALIQGLINGIKSMSGAVVSFVKGIAGDVISGVKGIFGIKSPSTVFAEVGGNLMEGLARGITRNAGAPVGALAGVSRQLVPALGAGYPGLGGGIGSSNPAPALSRVVNINPGAIAVSAPGGDPYQVANAVLDRLVARAR